MARMRRRVTSTRSSRRTCSARIRQHRAAPGAPDRPISDRRTDGWRHPSCGARIRHRPRTRVRATGMGEGAGVPQPATSGTLRRPNPPEQAGFTPGSEGAKRTAANNKPLVSTDTAARDYGSAMDFVLKWRGNGRHHRQREGLPSGESFSFPENHRTDAIGRLVLRVQICGNDGKPLLDRHAVERVPDRSGTEYHQRHP